MLEHDELLPDEQAYPGLVQELRITYRMKPEEKLVLSRVHERLAQSSHPLPLLESIQAGGHARPLRLVPPAPSASRPPRSRQIWLRRLNTFVAVLFIGFLVGALVFTFSMINHTRVGSSPITVGPTSSIRMFLVPAEKGRVPTRAELEAACALLSQRFMSFGLKGSSARVTTTNGQSGILVQLPHFGGNEQQTIGILLETGVLAFWDTGPGGIVAQGTHFNSGLYTQYNPGGKPRFINQDLDPNYLAVMQDPSTGLPALSFIMMGDAFNRFQHYTANNIGHALTVVLDDKVISSGIIETAVSGPFEISANFTHQQASAIVSVLKYGPLPVELKN